MLPSNFRSIFCRQDVADLEAGSLRQQVCALTTSLGNIRKARTASAIKSKRIFIKMAGGYGRSSPEQSVFLTEALRAGGVHFIIENHVGANHGWTVPNRDRV